jgi:hypothetical protein
MSNHPGTDIRDMCSGGIVGDMKLLCDLVVIHTLTDQFGNLNLPACQVKTFSNIIPLSRTQHKIIIADNVQKSSLFIKFFSAKSCINIKKTGFDRLRKMKKTLIRKTLSSATGTRG